jgi:hypothetical protein
LSEFYLCISETSSSIKDSSRTEPAVLSPSVISSGNLPDEMKNLFSVGFVLIYKLVVSAHLCEIFYVNFNKSVVFRKNVLQFQDCGYDDDDDDDDDDDIIIIIVIQFVSLYLIARAVRQHLKPRCAIELSLMTSLIE